MANYYVTRLVERIEAESLEEAWEKYYDSNSRQELRGKREEGSVYIYNEDSYRHGSGSALFINGKSGSVTTREWLKLLMANDERASEIENVLLEVAMPYPNLETFYPLSLFILSELNTLRLNFYDALIMYEMATPIDERTIVGFATHLHQPHTDVQERAKEILQKEEKDE